MRKTNELKGKRGITLIALVVTIVVLIILATISVNIVFSEDGIIKRAEQAADLMKISQVKEEADLIRLSYELAESAGETISTEEDVQNFFKMKETIANSGYGDKVVWLEGNLMYTGNDEADKEVMENYGIDTSLADVINNMSDILTYEDGYIKINMKVAWGTGETGSITLTDLRKLITNSDDETEQAKVTFEDKSVNMAERTYTGKRVLYNGKLLGIIVAVRDVDGNSAVNVNDLGHINTVIGKSIEEVTGWRVEKLKAADVDNDGILTQADVDEVRNNTYFNQSF